MAQSKLYNWNEFGWKRDYWQRSCPPASGRSVTALFEDWKMELNRVPYLKLVKSEERLGGAYRVFFKFACRLPACGFDIAMAELGRIWLDLSSGTDSVHTIRQVGDGFEFCFVELTPVGQWISGLIVVEPAPVPELQKPKKFMLKLR